MWTFPITTSGGDIEKSRGVADDVKHFIEKHADKSDDKHFKQVALMKIKDMHAASSSSASQSSTPQRTRTRLPFKQSPLQTPPKQSLVAHKILKKPASRHALANARIQTIMQKFDDDKVERGASVPTCANLAEYIFQLWVRKAPNQKTERLLRRLAQLAYLTYLGGSRLGETSRLKHERLSQDTCRFTAIRYKGVNKNTKALKRGSYYYGSACKEEDRDHRIVWKLLGLDKSLLFERMYSRPDNAAAKLSDLQARLGLMHCTPIGGGSAAITGHSFRRARGVHLKQHGVDLEHIREVYGHKDLQQTENYLHVGMPLWQLDGTVEFKDGVIALLRQKLEAHIAAQADDDGDEAPGGAPPPKKRPRWGGRSIALFAARPALRTPTKENGDT